MSTCSDRKLPHPIGILEKARRHSLEGDWGLSFHDYVVALRILSKSMVGSNSIYQFEHEFALTMAEFTHTLLEKNEMGAFYSCIAQALAIFPRGNFVLYQIGRNIMYTGNFSEACGFLQKSLKIDPSFAQAEKYVNISKELLVSRWHYRMLNDSRRNLSYKRAIQSVISPSDTVLDIGCGSGLLSFYAADAGAAVIACDSNDTLYKIAEETVELNRYRTITVLKDPSTSLVVDGDDVKFTAVVTEIFDAGLFGENALGSILDAWERLLVPTGKVVPMAAVLYVCAVESELLAKKYRVVHSKGNQLFTHLNFKDIIIYSDVDEPYDTKDLTLIGDVKYVSDAVEVLQINFQDVDSIRKIKCSTLKRTVQLNLLQDCKVDAYAMWFDLILSEDISITNDPRSSERCAAWDVAVFYRSSALDCRKNDVISVDIEWREGIVHVVKEDDPKVTKFYVSKEILRLLNDTEYVNSLISATRFSCLHLVQLFTFENISVWDNMSFPIIGILLLSRGISRMTYTNEEIKPIIEKLAEQNNITLDSIVYEYERSSEDNVQYEMIVNNLLHTFGTLISENIPTNDNDFLRPKGIVVPQRIKMYIRLVNSSYLNTYNRVFDSNLYDSDSTYQDQNISKRSTDSNTSIDSLIESRVWQRTTVHDDKIRPDKDCDSSTVTNVTKYVKSGRLQCSVLSDKPKNPRYRVAELMNCYQVTLNSIPGSNEFQKSYVSDEVCVYGNCGKPRFSETITVTATCDGTIDAIQSYYKVYLISEGGEITTGGLNSYVNNVYYLIDPPVKVCKGKKVNVMIFCEDTDAVKMVVDDLDDV